MSTGTRKSAMAREARVAGLRDFQSPTLESVEKRRSQLWIFAGVIIVSLAGGMVLLSLDNVAIRFLESLLPGYTIRVLVLGFAALVGFYLIDKEVKLRDLTRDLIDERVLSAALSNRLKEVSILSEVGKAINQVLELDDVLRMILRSAVDLLETEEGSIMLVEEKSGDLIVQYARSSTGKVLEGMRVPMGQGISGWVAQHREPILITGKAEDGMFKDLRDRADVPRSALCVPLISQEELFGVLNINDPTGTREFSEYDLRALGLFAEHAAIAIRNASVFEKERQAVTRLEEVDRMKTEFIATVSHELRTPLTSIIGCAKTVRRRGDEMNDLQRTEFLEMIEKQGERLLRMVEEILSASRIESGAPPQRREPIDLTEMSREIIKEFQTAGADNVFVLNAEAGITAFGDPMAMEQVITNLVENAVKYSPHGSGITIDINDGPGAVELKVRDEGKGISDEDLPTIFERFRQLDQSATRRTGGVGLGLYLVKRLVEAQYGSISVVSKQGAGSTFILRFPKRRER